MVLTMSPVVENPTMLVFSTCSPALEPGGQVNQVQLSPSDMTPTTRDATMTPAVICSTMTPVAGDSTMTPAVTNYAMTPVAGE